jgi:hypothetical protein
VCGGKAKGGSEWRSGRAFARLEQKIGPFQLAEMKVGKEQCRGKRGLFRRFTGTRNGMSLLLRRTGRTLKLAMNSLSKHATCRAQGLLASSPSALSRQHFRCNHPPAGCVNCAGGELRRARSGSVLREAHAKYTYATVRNGPVKSLSPAKSIE